MHSVGKSLNNIISAGNESHVLNKTIVKTSQLAENVSSKVRRLDEARVRV